MNATEIVIREVQGDGGFQVRQLLAERIGESGKTPHLHPHGQVLPLDKAGRDVVRNGIASPHLGYILRDPWWGVPPFGAVMLAEVPEQFDKLREVHVQPKGIGHSGGVVGQTISGELRPPIDAPVQVTPVLCDR